MRRTEKYAAVTRDESDAADGRFPTAVMRSVKAELVFKHLNTLYDFPAFFRVCDALFQLKPERKEFHVLSVLSAINVHDRLRD